MFTKETISFNTSGSLNKLVADYLLKTKETEKLYAYYPDVNGYSSILKQPELFEHLDRTLLVEQLKSQASATTNTSAKSRENIELLLLKNTYTVTTGHQLCLFTGPLYFIYKILSVINQCEWLTKHFPENKFVPVYWMASEDHDFEEVNHAFVFGKKLQWNSSQTGAVGAFKTEGINEVINELQQILGENEQSKQLISLFRTAYNHKTLADATRYLVNELFGKYGLVVLDGNDAKLKKQFRSIITKDIKENLPYKKVTDTLSYLTQLNYNAQVNPREINCFYIEDQKRNRIEKQNGKYVVLNTTHSFTESEMDTIIQNETEKISPNVVLRPLYQQHILPNIAYVGGPGELNYWLEYKAMFDELNVQFPILQPRHFALMIDKGSLQKITKLELEPIDFFKNEKDIIDAFVQKKGSVVELENEKSELQSIFDKLSSKALEIDKTLENTVKAELQKTINSINGLEAKLNKALKQRSETEINQIKTIKAKLFPEGIPQERYDNISAYLSKFGMNFIDELKGLLGDNELKYLILKES